MNLHVEWLPADGRAEQLLILLHGAGHDGGQLAPLAEALGAAFPQAAVLCPDAPLAVDDIDDGAAGDGVRAAGPHRQWFSESGATEADILAALAAARSTFDPWLRDAQRRLGVGPAATALGGFSQGATLALETALASDGLVGRVLAFGGRFDRLPTAAPRHTTLHLFHGRADAVVPVRHATDAWRALSALRGDATLDIAEGVGHQLHPALVQRALFRLRNHIPARTWAAALGGVSGLSP